MNKSKIVIMAANCYEMTDEVTQQKNAGMVVEYYFFGENGEASFEPKFAQYQEHVGVRRSKANCLPEFTNKLKNVPALYEGDFDMAIGSDGKPVLKLVDFEYLSDIAISIVASKSDADETKATNGVKK